jgi:hypothetical protein
MAGAFSAKTGVALTFLMCSCGPADRATRLDEFAGCYRIGEGASAMRITSDGEVYNAAGTRLSKASVNKASIVTFDPPIAVSRTAQTIVSSAQAHKPHLTLRHGGQIILQMTIEGSSQPAALVQEMCPT